jgi:major membrane immunogen (membrane-anchored lipoprotein)
VSNLHGRLKILAIFILFVFSLVACSSSDSSSQSKKNVAYDSQSKSESIGKDSAYVPDSATKKEEKIVKNPYTRMVIYNADLQLEVKDLKIVQTKISELVNEIGGYIVDQTTSNYQDDQRATGSLTVRIPQKNFQSFISKIESLGIRVEQQNIAGQDVTEEYVDLEARLKSKQIVETRLIQFMNQAKDTKDLLQISNELATIQEEIETIQGKIKYLANQTSLSTVTIQLFENKVVVPNLEKDHLNTWDKTKKQFMNSINFIIVFCSNLIIFIIGNMPIIFIIGLFVLIFYLLRRRNKKKQD